MDLGYTILDNALCEIVAVCDMTDIETWDYYIDHSVWNFIQYDFSKNALGLSHYDVSEDNIG